jgi:hypothetical protein
VVDYDKPTGSSGTMRIRDTGTAVEFWINSGNSSTWINGMDWQYTVNGHTSAWQDFDYAAGSGWKKLGGWNVSYSQTVVFKIEDTGTSGFGGPTTHSRFISRAGPPDAPPPPTISNITTNSVQATMVDPDNNGAAISSRQIAYRASNNVNGAANTGNIGSDKTVTITGLAPGVQYYFWARAGNSQGWGPWSAVRTAGTLSTPGSPSAPTVTEIKQTSVKVEWNMSGTNITGWDVGYAVTGASAPTTIIAATSPKIVTGLTPATDLTFWVRAKNSAGPGPWSAGTNVHIPGGAFLKVGPVWKEAIPYVRVGGVWKVAQPWVRNAGVWKETT